MIVGHNPGLTDLANELSPGLTSNIPTAGFVSLLVGTDDWDLRTRDSVKLIEYDYPKKKKR
jgi:phosphohistidine phosphatase